MIPGLPVWALPDPVPPPSPPPRVDVALLERLTRIPPARDLGADWDWRRFMNTALIPFVPVALPDGRIAMPRVGGGIDILGAPPAINVDPPPGTQVIQGQPDGSLVVSPLPRGAAATDNAGPINAALQQAAPATGTGGIGEVFPPMGRVRLVARALYATTSPIVIPYGTVLDLNGAIIQPQAGGFSAVSMHSGFAAPYPDELPAGGIRDGNIEGTVASAAANAVGLDWGDGSDYQIDRVRVTDFKGAGGIGIWEVNRFAWTEKAHVSAQCYNNTQQYQIDSVGGVQSHMYGYHDVHCNTQDGQAVILLINGAFVQNARRFGFYGNCYSAGHGAPQTAVPLLSLSGQDGAGNWSRISNSALFLQFETDNTPANPGLWQTIVATDANPAHNRMLGNYGMCTFLGANFVNTGLAAGQFTFAGPINGDSALIAVNQPPPGFTPGIATLPPAVATPAVPASGTAITNTTSFDVIVYLNGGTITGAAQINGTAVGDTTARTYYLPAGSTIKLAYSAAPTWQWIGV